MEIKDMNQYNVDEERFINIFSKFTGVGKRKLKAYLKDNTISSVFEHPTALDINNNQLDKILQLKELRYLFFNLKSYEKEYQLNSVTKAGEYFKEYFSGVKDKENFACAFLDNKNKIITTKILFTGTINAAPVFPREICKMALKYDASSVIISHNHPSASLDPSREDMQITKQINDALAVLKIKLQDHIIVGGYDYLSFADRGIMPSESRGFGNQVGEVQEVNFFNRKVKHKLKGIKSNRNSLEW